MDQFLPGDVSIMVLKYLATKGCESTVVTMIEEMPGLQFYVPRQPIGVSKSDFVRMLGRPSLTPTLNDVLNDYGHAKILVMEAVQNHNSSSSPLRHCDSLVTQLKLLSNILNEMTTRMNSTVQKLVTPETKSVAEKGINTEQPSLLLETNINRCKKVTSEVETQTVELPILEIGSEESLDVPLMFYNSLMSDSNLQNKLAKAINEHMTDSSSSKNDVLQKVCSTAETEIDKFLVDLLKDVPHSADIETFPSISGLIPESQNSVFNEVERNLANLFQDAQSLIAEEPPVVVTESSSISIVNITEDHKKVEESEPVHDNILNSSNDVDSNMLGGPPAALIKVKVLNDKIKQKPNKRITPMPAFKSDVNPVFEKVPVVERAVSSEGHPYSVHVTKPVTLDWQKLGRRPIVPKIPSPVKSKLPTPVKHCTDINLTAQVKILSASVNKRKAKTATPVKLTPEKAKNSDLNFFLAYHDSPKLVSSSSVITTNSQTSLAVSECNSIRKETPSTASLQARSIQTPAEKPDQISDSVKANSAVEVTPILDIPNMNKHSSNAKSVSPRVHRLIASAQKVRATSTQANLVRRSYSTPRKKKHVRNLLFTTPPSMKNNSIEPPGSPSIHMITNGQGVSLVLPLKRKHSDEEEVQSKSKKRLQWVDNSDYKSTAFPDRNFISTRLSESMTILANKVLETKKFTGKNEKPTHELSYNSRKSTDSLSTSCKQPSLPQILEETPFTNRNHSAKQIAPPDIIVDDVISREVVTEDTTFKNVHQEVSSLPSNISSQSSPLTSSILVPTTEKSPLPFSAKIQVLDSIVSETERVPTAKPNSQTKEIRSQCLMSELFGSDDSFDEDRILIKSNIKRPSSRDTKGKRAMPNVQKRNNRLPKQPQLLAPNNNVVLEKQIQENSPELNTSLQQDKFTKPLTSTSNSVKPKRGRKSKREVDLAAAKALAHDAVPLGINSTSPSSPSKFLRKKCSVVPSEAPIEQEILIAPSKISAISTPLKNPIITFSILPPLGFPDPTPTKIGTTGQTTLQGHTSDLLVTPMKHELTSSISPPVTLPPTPRYLVNDADADSNSTSGTFKMFDGLYSSNFINSTPGKILGPPPTPGRNLFLDENSEGCLPALCIKYSEQNLDVHNPDHPLDLSSPVAPHRMLQTIANNEITDQVKEITSPEKPESSLTMLGKKLAAWKAKTLETSKDGEFQIPKGAPKKTSPPGLKLGKMGSSAAAIIHTKALSTNGESLEKRKQLRKNTDIVNEPIVDGSSGPGMTFFIEGKTKKLSMSHHQTLLGLVEMGKGSQEGALPKKLKHENVSKINKITEPPRPQLNNLLKNIDLNHFLNNVVHKVGKKTTND